MEQWILKAAAFLKLTKKKKGKKKGSEQPQRVWGRGEGVSSLAPPRWGGPDPVNPLGTSPGRVRQLEGDGAGTALPERGCGKRVPGGAGGPAGLIPTLRRGLGG